MRPRRNRLPPAPRFRRHGAAAVGASPARARGTREARCPAPCPPGFAQGSNVWGRGPAPAGPPVSRRRARRADRAALIYHHASQDRDKMIAEALGDAFKAARKGTKKRSGTQQARKRKKAG